MENTGEISYSLQIFRILELTLLKCRYIILVIKNEIPKDFIPYSTILIFVAAYFKCDINLVGSIPFLAQEL